MATRQQKRRNRNQIIFVILLIILAVAVKVFEEWWYFNYAKPVRYPEFGIDIPGGYAIHGIDVSRYQQAIDWDEVKTMKVKEIKIGFAFIKATEGTTLADPNFLRNWKKSKKAGVYRGAYHFFTPSKDGRTQAQNFIDNVELDKDDLPPVLDIEQINGTATAQLKKEAKKWLEVIENHYGIKPIIYTNVDFYKRYLGSEFDEYPLWAAHYYQPYEPRINRGWVFWQHSDKGRVNGITAKVDFNVFNGDSVEFRNMLID